MSTPIPNRSASFKVCSNISTQAGERKLMKRSSAPLTPYIGVISRPPRPAFSYFSISAVRSRLLTALPCHHQRVHGLVCRVTGGQLRREVESWPPAFVTLRGSAAASAKASDKKSAIEVPLILAVTNSPVQTARSDCPFRLPVQTARSDCPFRLPVQTG